MAIRADRGHPTQDETGRRLRDGETGENRAGAPRSAKRPGVKSAGRGSQPIGRRGVDLSERDGQGPAGRDALEAGPGATHQSRPASIPVFVPRLVRGDRPAARRCRSMSGAFRQEQGRDRLCSIGLAQKAADTDAGLGGLSLNRSPETRVVQDCIKHSSKVLRPWAAHGKACQLPPRRDGGQASATDCCRCFGEIAPAKHSRGGLDAPLARRRNSRGRGNALIRKQFRVRAGRPAQEGRNTGGARATPRKWPSLTQPGLAGRSLPGSFLAGRRGRLRLPSAEGGRRSAGLVFRHQLPHFWNEIHWHIDRRVRGALICSFVLGHGFFVALRLVMIEYLLDSAFVPTGWKVLLVHCALLRLRRRARFAFGPSSYAVITKTEFGTGSGT